MKQRNFDRSHLNPNRLLMTRRGMDWIDQFDPDDRVTARRLISGLTLVSSNEFEIALKRLIDAEIAHSIQPTALYAIREVNRSSSLFEQPNNRSIARSSGSESVDAVGSGSEIGSEGRVAALITQMSRASNGMCLSHPSLETMRQRKCRLVLLVDDLLGSGNRVKKFFRAIWLDPTIRSWTSLGLLRFRVVVFASTVSGRDRIAQSGRIDSVICDRSCPTFRTLPWNRSSRNSCVTLCKRYGSKASGPRWILGYENTMASLIFDHGCPNNTPSILWARGFSGQSWSPLFPNRGIETAEHSVFPPEIANREPSSVLLDAGQTRLAQRRFRGGSDPGTIVIILLALIAKGYRRDEALTFATGLSNRELDEQLQRCMECEWITPTRRMTPHGVAELRNARRAVQKATETPPIGDDYYYPQALRESTYG